MNQHVGAHNTDKNDGAFTIELFRWFAEVVARKYPDFLHVVATDSPKIYTMMPEDSCNPAAINVSDEGVNRGHDHLFGSHGFKWIFENDPELSKIEAPAKGWTKAAYAMTLWKDPRVKGQLMQLEQILADAGMVLIFHPVAHPMFAAIELLWRDMKWDYRVNWNHTRANLDRCIETWLGPSDHDMLQKFAKYFATARAYIRYYLSGGAIKIGERALKKAAANSFDNLDNPQKARRNAMSEFYKKSKVPTTEKAKKKIPLDTLRAQVQNYAHEVNWMRLKHGDIEKDPVDEK